MTESKSTEQFEIYPLPAVQRELVRRLTTRASARFAELKPEDIDSNLYTYHLNELMSEGYVEKVEKAYRLTTVGRRYAGIISTATGFPRLQPKSVVMLAITNARDEYVFYRWYRQPFMNLVSLPYGKVHFGTTISQMAKRELLEKVGLTTPPTYCGSVAVKTLHNDEILNHMIAQVFVGADNTTEVKSNANFGECFWASPEKVAPSELIPGTLEIIKLVKEGQTGFFEELEVTL